jgi:hypothetical protein
MPPKNKPQSGEDEQAAVLSFWQFQTKRAMRLGREGMQREILNQVLDLEFNDSMLAVVYVVVTPSVMRARIMKLVSDGLSN